MSIKGTVAIVSQNLSSFLYTPWSLVSKENRFYFLRNTVKKPFVVLQKTPHPKNKALMATTPENTKLNTTFTFEMSDDENAEDNEISKIEKRIPMMNAIEASVVEESLRSMIDRIQQVCALFIRKLSIKTSVAVQL